MIQEQILERAAESCPYCKSDNFVKRGVRENKHQQVQLYLCRNQDCGRTFTSRTII
ncbi:MAG: IS1 family transposase [Candidatus Sungbacteria bacterium]|nr:IS1 family transposase [Candidatus Sungbacteria bacterium]